MILERLMEEEIIVGFFCFLSILSWWSLEKYSLTTLVQSRTSTAQETKNAFFPSESLEQQSNRAVQVCDQHCRNACLGRKAVAPTSVACESW